MRNTIVNNSALSHGFINSLTVHIRTIAMILSLNCLVLGDDPEKMFTVEIDEAKNVSILKKLIKEEKASRLEHVDASDLQLWKLDLHLDGLGAEPVRVDFEKCKKLSPPRLKLPTFFNDTLDENRLHIIAEARGTSH
jgi:Leucine-rich repeat (LRR) protein